MQIDDKYCPIARSLNGTSRRGCLSWFWRLCTTKKVTHHYTDAIDTCWALRVIHALYMSRSYGFIIIICRSQCVTPPKQWTSAIQGCLHVSLCHHNSSRTIPLSCTNTAPQLLFKTEKKTFFPYIDLKLETGCSPIKKFSNCQFSLRINNDNYTERCSSVINTLVLYSEVAKLDSLHRGQDILRFIVSFNPSRHVVRQHLKTGCSLIPHACHSTLALILIADDIQSVNVTGTASLNKAKNLLQSA
jgi:hypothetical protein